MLYEMDLFWNKHLGICYVTYGRRCYYYGFTKLDLGTDDPMYYANVCGIVFHWTRWHESSNQQERILRSG